MEKQNRCIENIKSTPRFYVSKSNLDMWKRYLKHYFVYIYLLLVTIFFGVCYFYTKKVLYFYFIFCFLLGSLVLFLLFGLFFNCSKLHRLKKEYKESKISIYDEFILITKEDLWSIQENKYSYHSIEKMFFEERKQIFVFKLKPYLYFRIHKKEMLEETFSFLVEDILKNKEEE